MKVHSDGIPLGVHADLRTGGWGKDHVGYGSQHEYFSRKPLKLRDAFDWFVVVRNPFDRIVSEFHCPFGGVGDRVHQYNERSFNEYLQDRMMRPDKPVACCNGKIRATRPWIENGGHYSPQHKYIDVERPMHVLRYETLATDFNNLMKAYGVDDRVRMTPEREYRNQPPRNGHPGPTQRRFSPANLSTQTVELILSYYRADFDMFGYSREI